MSYVSIKMLSTRVGNSPADDWISNQTHGEMKHMSVRAHMARAQARGASLHGVTELEKRQATWLQDRNQAEQATSRKNSPLLSLITVAVSPAALEPLPEVYTEMGACRHHRLIHLAV